MGKWFFQNGDCRYLSKHDLNSDSVVFDVGGYTGVFTDRLVAKYDAEVYVFEPVKTFFDILKYKYKDNPNVIVCNFGLSNKTEEAEIGVREDSSSIYIDSEKKEAIKLVDIYQFMKTEDIKEVDLISINIEGGEYVLLNRIIDKKIAGNFKFIQVQFHNFVESAEKEREHILKALSKTHEIAFTFPFIWEGFKRKK